MKTVLVRLLTARRFRSPLWAAPRVFYFICGRVDFEGSTNIRHLVPDSVGLLSASTRPPRQWPETTRLSPTRTRGFLALLQGTPANSRLTECNLQPRNYKIGARAVPARKPDSKKC